MHSGGMVDWNDLRYLLAVARTGSTIAAARALGVSQPTVQRRLSALERQIGRRLVERRPSGCRLTELAAALLPHVERVEEHVAAFNRQLKASSAEPEGTIRVTCPEADIDRLLGPIFARFEARHPGVRLEVLVTDRTLDLAKGEADIAMRGGPVDEGGLIGRRVADCPWFLYASRPYLERHGRPRRAADLRDHAVVAYTGQMANLGAARWLQSVAGEAQVAAYSSSVLGALSVAKAGRGLALLLAHVGEREETLVRAFEPQPELTDPFMLLVHPDLRNVPRIRAFLDFIGRETATIQALFRGRLPATEVPPAEPAPT